MDVWEYKFPGHINLRGPPPDLARWRWRCVNDLDCVREDFQVENITVPKFTKFREAIPVNAIDYI